MAKLARRHDDLKLHLRVFDADHEISARARVGPTRLMELLPLAREISDGVTAIAAAHDRAQGEAISCRRGCAWCCHQLVPIAPAEAVRLAQVVEAMPRPERRAVKERFAKAVKRMEEIGLLEPGEGRSALRSTATTAGEQWEDVSRRYHAARIPCPLLEDGACSVYAERPMVCREYLVTTPPSLCESLDAGLRATPRPVRMSEVLVDVTNEALGRDDRSVPLPLSLEWAGAHAAAFDREGDGEELAMALVRCIQAADDHEAAT